MTNPNPLTPEELAAIFAHIRGILRRSELPLADIAAASLSLDRINDHIDAREADLKQTQDERDYAQELFHKTQAAPAKPPFKRGDVVRVRGIAVPTMVVIDMRSGTVIDMLAGIGTVIDMVDVLYFDVDRKIVRASIETELLVAAPNNLD